jgi:hypothetical protein
MHKSELQDWLKNPVTQQFKEALRLEAEASKRDLAEYIDGNDPDATELYNEVNLSKAVRSTYMQFADSNGDQTIINMFRDHELLTEEEESNDSN